MADHLEEREALQEVRKLKSKIRHDSRGRLGVAILVAFWVLAGLLGRLLPKAYPWQWIPAGLLFAAPITAVWYLEKTSRTFGGAKRPQIIARYIVLQILFLILAAVATTSGGEWVSPYAVLAYALSPFLLMLIGALVWKLLYGFGLPWIFGVLTQLLLFGVGGELRLRWGSPWGSLTLVLAFVAGAYVCLDSTMRRLPSESS